MSFEIILFLLVIVSALTGLVTEAIKKILDEVHVGYYSNILAGFVAIVLSVAIGKGYTILIGTEINQQMAVYLIALVFLSWLCAMVGYDKVVQTISQLHTKNTESTESDTAGSYEPGESPGSFDDAEETGTEAEEV